MKSTKSIKDYDYSFAKLSTLKKLTKYNIRIEKTLRKKPRRLVKGTVIIN